jgi:hypothetical protein
MNSTGNNSDKAGYRIILLLVVGLTAFSSAMKELNQFQQLSLDASRLVAQLTQTLTPAEVPPAQPETLTVVKVESCESKQSEPAVELPWLANVAAEETSEIEETEPPVIAKRARNTRVELAKLKKLPQIDIDPVQFEVRILSDHDAEAAEISVPEIPAPPAFAIKNKTRKPGTIRLNTRDREMFLKTLNRSINLRIAS